MPSEIILHALGLHFHQPTDALHRLLHQDAGELRRILLCYERLARHAHKYASTARLHVAFSGVLLAQLRDPAFIEACRHLVDVAAILDSLRSAPNIEFVATGYYHAPLPLIPPEDWDAQLQNDRTALIAWLGRTPKGFFPPAGQFTREMIPALLRCGYEYVLLPHASLAMPGGQGADPYRAYRLCHGKDVIHVVPWDQGFSHAQESGLDAAWFADESRNGVSLSPASDAPYLLTTWSDGDAGEWFRNMDEAHGFFGHFFSPCMEFCETGEFPVHPVQLAEHLHRYPPTTEVTLAATMQTDALVAGLDVQARLARDKLFSVVGRYGSVLNAAAPAATSPTPEQLRQARELTLQAEQSSFLLGDAGQLDEMLGLLARAERLLASLPLKKAEPAPVKVSVPAPSATLPVQALQQLPTASASAVTVVAQQAPAVKPRTVSLPAPDPVVVSPRVVPAAAGIAEAALPERVVPAAKGTSAKTVKPVRSAPVKKKLGRK